MKARNYMPALHEGNKILPSDILDDRLPPVGNVYFAKKTADADYSYFFNKYNYVNDRGQNSVQNTITAAIALLQNYDTLILCPGNWDEADVVSLDDLKGVKILGYNNGMTWGEGSTCWRQMSAIHTNNILEMSDNKSIEIAGINFICTTADKEAIKFDGFNFATHIHHCRFTGNTGGSDLMAYGINAAGSYGPDLYVHNCMFDRVKTTAIIPGHQRNVIEYNVFIVGANCKGIVLIGNTTASFNVIQHNTFLGNIGASSYGIYSAVSTIGNFLIVNNILCGFHADRAIVVAQNGDTNCANNYINHASSGAITVANPSA